jgi:hypothetical protein
VWRLLHAPARELDGHEDEGRARRPLGVAVAPLDYAQGEVQDVASLLGERARGLSREVQQPDLEPLALEPGLEGAVDMSRLRVRRLIGREGQDGLLVRLDALLGERGGRLLVGLLARQEAQAASLADEEAEHLGGDLVENAKAAPPRRLVVEQAVASGKVEQPPSDVLELFLDHGVRPRPSRPTD